MIDNLSRLLATVEKIGVDNVREALIGLCDGSQDAINAWRQADSPMLDSAAEQLEKDMIIGWKLLNALTQETSV